MEKYIQREMHYSKSIKFDEDTIREIQDLYTAIDVIPVCSIITENNIHYNFQNLDELFEYDFLDKIKQIEFKNKEYSNIKTLTINFEVNYLTGFLVYGEIVKISYCAPDENKDILLKGKIKNFFKQNSTNNWIVGKFGLFCLICFWSWPIAIFQVIKSMIKNESVFPDFSFKLLVLCLIIFIVILLIRTIDKFNCKTFFEPIKYNLGKQKKKLKRLIRLKVIFSGELLLQL